MKKKPLFFALFCAAALALFSCANEVDGGYGGAAGTIEKIEVSFPANTKIASSIKSQVFKDDGASIASVTTCFLEGYENVPFLRLQDVAIIIGEINGRGYDFGPEAGQDGLYYYKNYEGSYLGDALYFDANKQTIYSDDFIRIVSDASCITPCATGAIGQSLFNNVAKASTKCPEITLGNASNQTTRVKDKERTEIKLGDYGIKMFELDATPIGGDQKELFVPFQALASAFFFFSIATFNGSDYYFWLNDEARDANTTFRAYDAGREARASRSLFMAEWNYANLCMFFDLNYSLKTKRALVGKDNIGPRINDSIFAQGLGFDLLSTDTATYDTALIKFLMGYIDDGHTSYIEPSLYQSKSAVASYKTLARKSSGPRNANLDKVYFDLANRRKNAGGGQGVFYIEEGGQKKMAVIVFDGFVGGDPSNLADPVSETDPDKKKEKWAALAATNTYQFFRKAFEDIGQYSTVKDVVIDLSCNFGGACDQCFLALCFLEAPENFYFGQWNLLDNSMTKFTASIKNDDNTTSLKKHYKFFVLTSGCSFSCANYFPAACKWQFNKNNLTVPLVGKKSGGGAANVKSAQTADGALFNTSCATQMCVFDGDEYICIDAGVPVDYEIEYDDFYSGSAIYQKLYENLKAQYPDSF